MQSPAPPSLQQSQPARLSRRIKFFIILPAIFFGTLVVLRASGLFYPFSMRMDSMAPACNTGDHIVAEGITFLARNPRRGDIVAINTRDIPQLPSGIPPGSFWVKRVAGLPGEHVELTDGKLYIDGKLTTLSNSAGKMVYDAPQQTRHPEWFTLHTNLTVPDGCYFLLGDDSPHSLDSRFFDSVPRKNIRELVVFCYWPPTRIGVIR
jgi:signal peptidase I